MFELDFAATQAAKRAAAARTGLDTGRVTYVAVDFARPGWIEALTATGYDPTAKAIFPWEAVTLYLSETKVRATLDAIGAHAAPGSVVILDLYGARMLEMAHKGAFAKTPEATDETLGFGLDLATDGPAAVADFATSAGYGLGAVHLLGSAHRKGAILAVATLEVPPPPR